MRWFIDFAVRLIRAGERVYAREVELLRLFCCRVPRQRYRSRHERAFARGGFENKSKTTSIVAQPQIATELPIKIEIPKINLSAVVVNPTITTVAVLDKELLKGAVRYPTSAKLGEDGNVVLFGHSLSAGGGQSSVQDLQ